MLSETAVGNSRPAGPPAAQPEHSPLIVLPILVSLFSSQFVGSKFQVDLDPPYSTVSSYISF